mmetsp:Transcript_2452/g.4153  ORF Transcript_2452/g.4153 Transcript_2452/m.4153 type:complete len:210 (-) Transcript_2452:700-1329(-)
MIQIPIFRHQRLLGRIIVADDIDHPIQVEEGNDETFQHFQPVINLFHPVLGAPDQNLTPEIQECPQNLFHGADFWRHTINQDVHIQRESNLQITAAIEHVHEHIRLHIFALGLQNHANVIRRLIPHIRKDRYLFGLDNLCQFLDQFRFLNLIGNLGDHNLPLPTPKIFFLPFTTQSERTTPGTVGPRNAFRRLNDYPPGRKVRPRHIVE